MEVRFPPELEGKLARIAAEQGRNSESLVFEAVERLVGYDEWFVREVEAGLAAAGRNEFVGHDQVRALILRTFAITSMSTTALLPRAASRSRSTRVSIRFWNSRAKGVLAGYRTLANSFFQAFRGWRSIAFGKTSLKSIASSTAHRVSRDLLTGQAIRAAPAFTNDALHAECHLSLDQMAW